MRRRASRRRQSSAAQAVPSRLVLHAIGELPDVLRPLALASDLEAGRAGRVEQVEKERLGGSADGHAGMKAPRRSRARASHARQANALTSAVSQGSIAEPSPSIPKGRPSANDCPFENPRARCHRPSRPGAAQEYRAQGLDIRALSRAQADLSKPEALAGALAQEPFDVLINTAGITDVDYCESHAASAFVANATAPGLLAALCQTRGARFVQLSSDYVFAGEVHTPRSEEDVTKPSNVYGQSKLQAEKAVLAAQPAALVLRVSWLFGLEKPSFPDRVIREGAGAAGRQRRERQVGLPDLCR